jgi:hypothetical protein
LSNTWLNPNPSRESAGHKAAARIAAHAQSGWNVFGWRLIDFLTALGQDVEITVRPMRKQRGDMSVTVV